jgi:hypothetical protein
MVTQSMDRDPNNNNYDLFTINTKNVHLRIFERMK